MEHQPFTAEPCQCSERKQDKLGGGFSSKNYSFPSKSGLHPMLILHVTYVPYNIQNVPFTLDLLKWTQYSVTPKKHFKGVKEQKRYIVLQLNLQLLKNEIYFFKFI